MFTACCHTGGMRPPFQTAYDPILTQVERTENALSVGAPGAGLLDD